MLRLAVLAGLLVLGGPALADRPVQVSTTQAQVDEALAAAPKGARFGLLVVDEAGKVLVAINPDQRFIPASITKLFTTAAAYALLPGIDQPDVAGGTQVFLVKGKGGVAPNVVLYGRGDARMSSAPDCVIDCLAALADAVAAKTRVIGDVVGDDTAFVDQRWSPGMSWNNFGSNDATAASALSLDSNELTVRVAPGPVGSPPLVTASGYVSIRNEAVTLEPLDPATPDGKLTLEHAPNSRNFRLYGYIPVNAAEWTERIGIDDSAEYAAWRFAELLRERGVRIGGIVRAVHRALEANPGVAMLAGIAADVDHDLLGRALADLTPSPLAQDITIINKVSQNHHAELLLRRISVQHGSGSLEDGLAAERGLFEQAGLPREGYDFSDGSGMSTYNRVSPRAAVALLRWASAQPWGPAWSASLPIAGVDGTLKRRFIGSPLAGNLSAKTGTLNATNAISGTLRAASGRQLTFAFFTNDVPDGQSAAAAMEAVLLLVAATN